MPSWRAKIDVVSTFAGTLRYRVNAVVARKDKRRVYPRWYITGYQVNAVVARKDRRRVYPRWYITGYQVNAVVARKDKRRVYPRWYITVYHVLGLTQLLTPRKCSNYIEKS